MKAMPALKAIDKVAFLPVEEIELPNGLMLYVIDAGVQPVCKIDVAFDAGTSCHRNRVLPSAVNALLNDGSSKHNAAQIADLIDGKGAFFMAGVQADYAIATLFTLSRFAADLLPVFLEIINDAVFPEDEISLYKSRMKQQFLIQSERVNVQSNQALLNALYGKSGAYGDPTCITDYDGLSQDKLVDFYKTRVQGSPQMIIASGKIDDKLKALLIQTFGNLNINPKEKGGPKIPITGKDMASTANLIEIPGKNTNQVSMRFGKIALPRNHPEFWNLSLLSTILGGYFGSRLNKVLREEKGLTYGVHAFITHLKHSSFLSIHSELNRDNRDEAYEAILSVFENLKSQPVNKEEIEMVIRYTKGSLLQSFDGPFAQSNYLLTSRILGLDQNRAHHYFDFLNRVTPEEITVTAQNYLNEDTFYKIIAGA